MLYSKYIKWSFLIIMGLLLFFLPMNGKSLVLFPSILVLGILFRPFICWKEFIHRNKVLLFYVGLLLLYIIFVWFFSPYQSTSFNKSFPLFLYVFFLWPYLDDVWHRDVFYKNPKRIQNIFYFLCIASLILTLIAMIYGHFSHIALYQSIVSSGTRGFAQYNETAVATVMLVFIFLAYLFKQQKPIVWILILYGVITILSFFAAGGSPFIIMIIGGGIFFLTLWKEKWTYIIMNIIIWALWGIIPLIPFLYRYALYWNFLDFSSRERFEIWAMNLYQITHGLNSLVGWIGRGWGAEYEGLNFHLWISHFSVYQCNLHTNPRHPHNYILQVLFELGPIGLLLVTLIMKRILKVIHSYQSSIVQAAAYSIFMGYLFMLSVLMPIWHFSMFYIVLFMMPLVMIVLIIKNSKEIK